MQALLIDHHGSPADLRVRDVTPPLLRPGELRVEVHAAAVNPSDVVSAEGRFPHSPLPRVLGRDFAGRVVEGPAEWLGVDVWGSGGDLGISRDGTHAEQIVLPVDGVARRPANLSVEAAASVGVPFVTAWSALVDVGRLTADEWVVVSGAAGAVGGAAVEIATARGARVVALVKDAGEAAHVDGSRVAAVARSDRNDVLDVVRDVTGGRGADLALNGVGGVIFKPLLDALADGGRMVVYSAAGGREVPLDLFELYRRRLELVGVNTAALTAVDGARILTTLAPLFERGEIRPSGRLERHPLSAAAAAYARVAGGAPAKIVLVPDARLAR
jgi:NADPH:quinone reductase-like Zn-dependent oxidoreductase